MINDLTERFRALHTTPALRLPNCWDAASAAVIAAAGAQAVATTSAGVAWSLGVPDGDALDRESAVAAVARIVRAVDVPVTADMESGYGASPDEVAVTLAAVAEAGAVGVNIEDAGAPGALRGVEEQAERLAAARDGAGPGMFINARIDMYLAGIGGEAERFEETVARAEAYRRAGADGIFVPGVADTATIGALAKAILLPLNVLAGPGCPPPTELDALGVSRVSVGPRVASAAYELARRATVGLLEGDTYDPVAGGIDYGTMNRLMS